MQLQFKLSVQNWDETKQSGTLGCHPILLILQQNQGSVYLLSLETKLARQVACPCHHSYAAEHVILFKDARMTTQDCRDWFFPLQNVRMRKIKSF
ncbi:uncharacterized protein AAGF69_002652 isoform 2-T2 [Amazona ochrocephala]